MNESTSALPLMSEFFWVAFIVSAVVAIPVYQGLLAMKSRQIVSEYVPEHAKKQGTPTMGGIIMVIGFLVACGYGLVTRLTTNPMLPASMVLFAGFALIGFLDDYIIPKALKGKRGLGWKQKFLMQIAVAAVAAIWIRHGHVAWLGVSVSVFIVLFFSNAYNFVDGMDGLAGSILVLFAAGLAALGLLELRQDIYMALCTGLIGAVIPFLFLNSPPAKIFMGDVGALPIGAVLGLIVNEMLRPGVRMLPADKLSAYAVLPPKQIASFAQGALPLLILSLVLVAELVPVPLQVASVKIRKKRLFPMTPIHHAFEKAGWPESKVVWMFALVQLLLVALALTVAMNGSGALP